MTKGIDTLVADIFSLFDGEFEVQPKHRVEKRDSKRTLRMSNLGQPDRKLWYELKSDIQGEVLSADTRMKFLYGHLLEDMILDMCIQAGHTVTDRQKEVEVDGVVGHIDAVIDGVLIDVKSASSYSFKKFRDGELKDDDPFGYLQQLAGYSHALGGVDAGFLVVDKTLGHICLDMYTKEELKEYDTEARIKRVRRVLEGADPPEHCYVPKPDGVSKTAPEGNGNFVLSVGCSYCPYKLDCWASSNGGQGLRTFIYSTGPRFFTHVEKEPRAEEITTNGR